MFLQLENQSVYCLFNITHNGFKGIIFLLYYSNILYLLYSCTLRANFLLCCHIQKQALSISCLFSSFWLRYVEARGPGLFQPFLRILHWNAPHPGDTLHPHLRRLRCPQMQGTKNKANRLRDCVHIKYQQVNQSFIFCARTCPVVYSLMLLSKNFRGMICSITDKPSMGQQ